jgi:REP element-mobilizing transposase RayT
MAPKNLCFNILVLLFIVIYHKYNGKIVETTRCVETVHAPSLRMEYAISFGITNHKTYIRIKIRILHIMSTELFHNKYRVPSARAEWHDYSGGEYFVTICTGGREHWFGKIVNGEMNLSVIGKYVDECIQNIHAHNSYATVPLYVIMPNHIHLIVLIDTSNVETTHVETVHAPSLQQNRWKNDTVNEQMQLISMRKHELSYTIGNMKFAHENAIPFSWQPRFHDRIIRNQDEMNGIAEYIEGNVAKWESDEFYKP